MQCLLKQIQGSTYAVTHHTSIWTLACTTAQFQAWSRQQMEKLLALHNNLCGLVTHLFCGQRCQIWFCVFFLHHPTSFITPRTDLEACSNDYELLPNSAFVASIWWFVRRASATNGEGVRYKYKTSRDHNGDITLKCKQTRGKHPIVFFVGELRLPQVLH